MRLPRTHGVLGNIGGASQRVSELFNPAEPCAGWAPQKRAFICAMTLDRKSFRFRKKLTRGSQLVAPVHVHDVINARARSLAIDTFKFDRELILEVQIQVRLSRF
jgi:hypothetical protein